MIIIITHVIIVILSTIATIIEEIPAAIITIFTLIITHGIDKITTTYNKGILYKIITITLEAI